MGAVAVERPPRGRGPSSRERGVDRAYDGQDPIRRFDDGATLEGRILDAWEALVGEGRTACLVCGGSMAADSGCSGCGSELS